jgi:hypothetical protein
MKRKIQRNSAEVLRDEMFMQDRVIGALNGGPRTILEIAQELNCPSAEVTRWVMAMRRYGKLIDLPKSRADDYYRYKLVEGK